MSKIFVQIASYRDPQLIPTLDSMFENAANPKDLQVCIAWQKDINESAGKYEKHNQVIFFRFTTKIPKEHVGLVI